MYRAVALLCLLALSLPVVAELGKFEPSSGCYIGAFIERDPVARGDIERFEEVVGKKHASYIVYVSYGRPFPWDFVRKCIEAGAVPHIAFEPNKGLHVVKDDAYLRGFAREARKAGCPIFLRWASEMNGDWTAYHGDPQLYIEKWRLVWRVFREEAPNVAMVWTPFSMPQSIIPAYYPGDKYVDWVGINIYSVWCHDGDPGKPAWFEDPVDFLEFIYELYADRKPIQISEFAATHFDRATGRDTTDFAIRKMRRLYSAIISDFPRVKLIDWFSCDTISEGLADNNYALTDNPRVLQCYRELISHPHFISMVPLAFWGEAASLISRPPRLIPSPPPPAPKPLPSPPRVTPPSPRGTKAPSAPRLKTPPTPKAERARPKGPIWVVLSAEEVRKGRMVEARLGYILLVRPKFVIFKLDGRPFALTNVPPYEVLIETKGLHPGKHTVSVEVHDEAGNTLKDKEPAEFTVLPAD